MNLKSNKMIVIVTITCFVCALIVTIANLTSHKDKKQSVLISNISYQSARLSEDSRYKTADLIVSYCRDDLSKGSDCYSKILVIKDGVHTVVSEGKVSFADGKSVVNIPYKVNVSGDGNFYTMVNVYQTPEDSDVKDQRCCYSSAFTENPDGSYSLHTIEANSDDIINQLSNSNGEYGSTGLIDEDVDSGLAMMIKTEKTSVDFYKTISDANPIKDFPYYNQIDNESNQDEGSYLTALSMITDFYGITSSEKTGVRTPEYIRNLYKDREKSYSYASIYQTEYGIEDLFNNMAKIAGANVRDRLTVKGTLEELQSLVAKGMPVLVHGTFRTPSHALIVLGYDGNTYTCNDPYGNWKGYSDSYDINTAGNSLGKLVIYDKKTFETVVGNAGLKYHIFYNTNDAKWLESSTVADTLNKSVDDVNDITPASGNPTMVVNEESNDDASSAKPVIESVAYSTDKISVDQEVFLTVKLTENTHTYLDREFFIEVYAVRGDKEYKMSGVKTSIDRGRTAGISTHVLTFNTAGALSTKVKIYDKEGGNVLAENVTEQAPIESSRITSESQLLGIDLAQTISSDGCNTFKNEGVSFVARYYSIHPEKTLTRDEALTITNAGMQIVTVYQDGNNSVDRFSYDEGVAQCNQAITLANQVGQPADSPIYFAVDFETSESTLSIVKEYFNGIKDTMNAYKAANNKAWQIGAYGSYYTVKTLKEEGYVTYTWQTKSWSYGEVYDYNLLQKEFDLDRNGYNIDYDDSNPNNQNDVGGFYVK